MIYRAREGSNLAFAFASDSRPARSRAHAPYSLIMVLSDYEHGLYILSEGHQTSP